jgi:hypothetical protein
MTQQHPITPPPELVLQWIGEFFGCTAGGELSDSERFLTTRAAQWGADQELEACCEWFVRDWTDVETADKLRTARRPKPLTVKQRAQRNLVNMINNGHLSPDLAELFTAAVEMAPDE